jgi:hypothetical protein
VGSDENEIPGQTTAELLVDAGLGDEAVLAALIDKQGLTVDQAAAALRAAKDGQTG